ncbi:MAG: EAL domain-containing protein, partial [Pseudomonadota bacterium]
IPLLAIFFMAIMSAGYLLFLSVYELRHLERTIAEIDKETDRARQLRDVVDKMNQSILSFTVVALDLSVDERHRILSETDTHFAQFRSAVAGLERSAADFLRPGQQAELVQALDLVTHSWSEIRDQFDSDMEEAEKAYHFLQITDEVRNAKGLLLQMEDAATSTAEEATRQAFERIEGSAELLFQIVLVVGATSSCALLGMGGLALATRNANQQLQHTLGELQHRDQSLITQNERFDAALGNMSQGLCMFDGRERLIVTNDRFREILRLPREFIQPGMALDGFTRSGQETDNAYLDNADAYACAVRTLIAGRESGSDTLELGDGRTVEIWYRPMQGGGWVTTFEDITERRQTEAKIAHMARHDTLTGLGNRALFRDEMERALLRVGRGDRIGVLCLDLDRFKIVNDTLGHPVGDTLLQVVADRLRQCVREVDTVVRLGGDEFAIIVADVEQPAASIALADRLLETIGAPYEIDDHKLNIGTSIGVAIAPDDGNDPDRLLKSADMALYRAKEDGRGTVRIFEPEMDAHLQSRRTLELQLRRALAEGEFELHYQPLINLEDRGVSGLEALLRWDCPQRGTVSPADFVPLAEEIGLIVPISEWVLHKACAEAADWPDDVKVAVNLSPVHFKHGDLVDTVASALDASGLAPNRLELEITEGVLLDDTAATIATLTALKELGVRIAMDDFGTGYCSLSYLQRFPFDKIKIDRSFIKDLGEGTDALAIVRAVSGLAESLGMITTAEGVETDGQLHRVRGEGCTEAQGYLFSRPAPASGVPAMLQALNRQIDSAA